MRKPTRWIAVLAAVMYRCAEYEGGDLELQAGGKRLRPGG